MLDLLAQVTGTLTFIEAMPVGVWIIDRTGRTQFSNRAGRALWEGEKSVPFDQYDTYRAWRIPDGQRIQGDEWASVRAVFSGQTTVEEEIEIECFNGTRKIVLNSAVPIRNDEDEILGALLINQDVTHRKEIETRFHLIAHAMQGCFFITGQSGNLSYISPGVETILGRSAAGLLENPGALLDLLSPADRARLYDEEERARFGAGGPERLQVTLDDGRARWLEFRVSALADHPRQQVGLVTDVTGMVESQQSSEHAYEFLRAVLDNTSNAVFTLDCVGIISVANATAEALSGFSYDELIGTSFDAISEGAEREAVRTAFHDALSGRKRRVETRIKRKDGEVREALLILSPLSVRGESAGVVAVLEDITRRKSIEIQLYQAGKMATMGEMATGIAHELNQPLNVIRFSSQTGLDCLTDTAPDMGVISQMFSKTLEQITRATRITDNLRTFGRKSTGNLSTIQVAEPLRNALGLAENRLRMASICVSTEITGDLPGILGDPIGLEQVFINILMNAHDALAGAEPPAGQKRIRASAKLDTGLSEIVIEIANNGPLIPAHVKHHILEPFFTTKEIGKGTGLGLSISYSILKLHNAQIEIESDADWTRFILRFPLPR